MVYVAISTVIAAVCVVLALKTLAFVREERLAQRGRIIAEAGSVGASGRSAMEGWRRWAVSGYSESPQRDTPFAKRLRAAGIGVAPGAVIGAVMGLAVLVGFGAASACGLPVVGVLGAAAVPVVARTWVWRRVRKRAELFDIQLAQSLPQIAASVRGSLTLERALRVALVHMENPLRDEFAHVLADASYGMPLHEALGAMAQRTQSEDVKTLAAATRIRQGSGGSVATALAMISSRVGNRLKAARELKVEIAGTRMAKWFVAAAMPGIFLIMYATNADFARFYATEPLGWAVLGIAAVLEAAGLLMAHAVTAMER